MVSSDKKKKKIKSQSEESQKGKVYIFLPQMKADL